MPRIDFSDLPDHGRLWVFPASRRLSLDESARLLSEADVFLDGWAAHGAPLVSGRVMVEGHFLLVGVDEDAEAPSGCSIDALVNRLTELGQEQGVTLVEHAPVWYRKGDTVCAVSRPEFRARVAAGDVDLDDPAVGAPGWGPRTARPGVVAREGLFPGPGLTSLGTDLSPT